MLDDVQGREAERERPVEELAVGRRDTPKEEQDPFAEIDFGSYFQDYLDPGFRTPNSFEVSEKPSFENFLSQPDTLTDHLTWQLGSRSVSLALREAAEYIVGNLNEDGYLPATDAGAAGWISSRKAALATEREAGARCCWRKHCFWCRRTRSQRHRNPRPARMPAVAGTAAGARVRHAVWRG